MSKRCRSLLIGAIAALLAGCNGNGGVTGTSPPALPYTSAFPVAKLPAPSINRVHRTSASGKIQHVVIIIQENPGIRQTEVCEALGIQKANFVPLLNELERRGLALRKSVAGDRRSSALHLTPLGNGTLQRARVIHDAYESRFITRLGKRGRDQLLALLNKVMDSG